MSATCPESPKILTFFLLICRENKYLLKILELHESGGNIDLNDVDPIHCCQSSTVCLRQ